jgi:DNA polymerase elongation subunit (family B)
MMTSPTIEDEWLWGWDPTPGIVSIWADASGRALVWRRIPSSGDLVRETARFRPWMLLDSLTDLQHLASALGPEGSDARVTYRELSGDGRLRFRVEAPDMRALTAAVLDGASRRLGKRVTHLRELDDDSYFSLQPDEQYLVATGRTYFKDLSFDQLRRMQFDLETTGLDPARDRIFMIAVRDNAGRTETLEAADASDAGEADLTKRLVARVQGIDPDVIENHNLHGFDLPFLDRRARKHGVPLAFGRAGPPGLRQRAARRGAVADDNTRRHVRFMTPGRELIDTMDAVRRHDQSTHEFQSYGLKAVARHLGVAGPDREYVRGDQIYHVYRTDPDRIRRYATGDVEEVAALARVLGGPSFALAQMAPRRYERLADAGTATGVIDPLLVRAYVRSNTALPAHEPDDGTPHSGAGLQLYASGVAHRVVKADVASLYPSLMRAYRIGPSRDRIGALLALVDRLVVRRLEAKAAGRAAPPGSPERYAHEAVSAAMKLVVNSAYGYLAAGGELARFADVHAANEVTRRGRAVLNLMCRELASRGVTLLEADTDGVYFAVPATWTETDERRAVSEVAALLPELVQLEFDGRYAAMLSHEPKNYALLGYDGTLILRGVAFRSSRAEPFGDAFLRRALRCLLVGDVPGVRESYLDTIRALRRREISTHDVSSRVRLTKTPEQYIESSERRRELSYDAMLGSGRRTWSIGDKVRVYRTRAGQGAIVPDPDEEIAIGLNTDPRDYDVEHYERVLHDAFATRLARAFTPDDFVRVFADPDQPSLFGDAVDDVRPILRQIPPSPSS